MNFIGYLITEMYIAYVLDKQSRKLLADKFPPKYPEFVGHHITLNFGVSPDTPLPANAKDVKVVGYADDGEGLEALVIEVNGKTQRPDGSIYHITWSLDRSKGKKPVHSNNLVKSGFTNIEPVAIRTRVEMLK